MVTDLKRELLRLLEEDEEFRYAVAGRIGILEILKRLDRLEEGQNKLWESSEKIWTEVKNLREEQEKLWESQNKLWEEVRSLREGQEKLWEGQNKLWGELKELKRGASGVEQKGFSWFCGAGVCFGGDLRDACISIHTDSS